jgi:hypothetical protein
MRQEELIRILTNIRENFNIERVQRMDAHQLRFVVKVADDLLAHIIKVHKESEQ